LQGELKASKSKIKLKNTVTIQQEKLLDERAESLQLLQKEAATARSTIEKLQSDNEDLHKRVDDLEKKLDESKKIITDNNHGTIVLLYVYVQTDWIANSY
jgi:spindle assembly abnormal protein 6